MPVWIGTVLDVLADPRTISLAALAVAVWSLMRTRPLTAYQTRLAELELKEKELVEASRTHAEVRARLISFGTTTHWIVLVNGSTAPASGVDIEFLDEKESPLPQGEREAKLPIPQIDPGDSVNLVAALSKDCWPPFKIALTWKDPDGTSHRKESTLYL